MVCSFALPGCLQHSSQACPHAACALAHGAGSFPDSISGERPSWQAWLRAPRAQTSATRCRARWPHARARCCWWTPRRACRRRRSPTSSWRALNLTPTLPLLHMQRLAAAKPCAIHACLLVPCPSCHPTRTICLRRVYQGTLTTMSCFLAASKQHQTRGLVSLTRCMFGVEVSPLSQAFEQAQGMVPARSKAGLPPR